MNIGFYATCDNRVFTTSTIYTEPLGGTQTATILLSRELAKSYNVYVFNPVEDECEDDGVYYVPHARLEDYANQLDVVICMAFEGLCTDPRIADVPRNILWKQHNEPFIDMEHMPLFEDTVDTVVLLSDYALETYSSYYESDKYEVIYAGVDVAGAVSLDLEDRLPHMIFMSCPNRGLRRFSKILPRITREIPEIELHSYGTFQIYGSAWKPSDDEYRNEPEYIELTQIDNFFQHDSIPYYDLMKILGRSLLFTYPCVFLESFCASAGISMACGLPMVTTHVGALKVLYPDYKYVIEVPPDDLGKVHTDWYADKFTEYVVELCRDKDEWRRASAEAIELAARFDIRKIAEEWIQLIEA